MKITYSKENINSFGGINFADHIISNNSLYETINQELGQRGDKATYSYSDLIRSYFLLTLCGGECAEDITENLCKELGQVKGFDVCSADILLRIQKELSTQKETYVSDTGIEHDFNVNTKMNKLIVRLLIEKKQLAPRNKDYIFDYDNQFIPTDKYDLVLPHESSCGN
ncbi:hypothetical protein [Carboxylicivirga marina]|uniref:Transposase DDE domain-containing protein n=1 Tax=Carboxylicivirga marina TaxID=2800988 RepID=A0ABS1HPE2_9BACT|nr:hypothetical protein [Carboxylicivirga marina]MBK3519412.1 hypothetical protein [Carboxylicivirga marina]